MILYYFWKLDCVQHCGQTNYFRSQSRFPPVLLSCRILCNALKLMKKKFLQNL
jgi:hypothetical protein